MSEPSEKTPRVLPNLGPAPASFPYPRREPPPAPPLPRCELHPGTPLACRGCAEVAVKRAWNEGQTVDDLAPLIDQQARKESAEAEEMADLREDVADALADVERARSVLREVREALSTPEGARITDVARARAADLALARAQLAACESELARRDERIRGLARELARAQDRIDQLTLHHPPRPVPAPTPLALLEAYRKLACSGGWQPKLGNDRWAAWQELKPHLTEDEIERHADGVTVETWCSNMVADRLRGEPTPEALGRLLLVAMTGDQDAWSRSTDKERAECIAGAEAVAALVRG